jgi:hypothetical protein
MLGTIHWYRSYPPWSIPIILAAGVAAVVASRWKFFIQWLKGVRGRDWPAVPAIIDMVNVVEEHDGPGGHGIRYVATLTYFYRNPELQMGEYSRSFDGEEEEDARAWAASYKGSTITVHVDPHDPSRSVMRNENL